MCVQAVPYTLFFPGTLLISIGRCFIYLSLDVLVMLPVLQLGAEAPLRVSEMLQPAVMIKCKHSFGLPKLLSIFGKKNFSYFYSNAHPQGDGLGLKSTQHSSGARIQWMQALHEFGRKHLAFRPPPENSLREKFHSRVCRVLCSYVLGEEEG
jgi:hypothetical protein